MARNGHQRALNQPNKCFFAYFICGTALTCPLDNSHRGNIWCARITHLSHDFWHILLDRSTTDIQIKKGHPEVILMFLCLIKYLSHSFSSWFSSPPFYASMHLWMNRDLDSLVLLVDPPLFIRRNASAGGVSFSRRNVTRRNNAAFGRDLASGGV